MMMMMMMMTMMMMTIQLVDVDLASAPLFIQMTSLSSARMVSAGYTAEPLESDRTMRMVQYIYAGYIHMADK